jgi:hypothetical protein
MSARHVLTSVSIAAFGFHDFASLPKASAAREMQTTFPWLKRKPRMQNQYRQGRFAPH